LLTAAGDPTRRPWLTLALLAAATVLLGVAVRAAARRPLSTRALLVTAALLRLVVLPLPPSLSTDVWRYLWDGRVALHRGDPYLVAPDDPRLAPLRDRLWQRVEHRDLPTVYPPLALALFVAPAALPPLAGLLAWKLLVCLADLGACALLMRLAAAGGWPAHRALWYAAHPLVALEVAGMGHLEPLGVAAALLCALLLSWRRPAAAGAAAAAAILVKLAPLAALPLWARQARAASAGAGERPVAGRGDAWRFLLPAAGLAALALAPVAVAVRGVPRGLAEYAVRWEFGGLLHEPLWRLLAAAGAPEAVKHGLDLMKEWVGMHELWNRAYPWAYPQLLSRLLLAIAAAMVVMRSLLSRHPGWNDPVRGGAALFGGLLVCSPTVYPWYLLWVLPWSALAARAPWLWVAAAAPLLYLPVLVGVALWPWVHLAVWGPFVLLWLVERRRGGGLALRNG
ncbi:MAG TPA: hypothetical protein VGV61_14830, partial [Thermoanaerobaculia bacterium]|nr:hypothetical protein [Thermoanaerobaculia bacterium]